MPKANHATTTTPRGAATPYPSSRLDLAHLQAIGALAGAFPVPIRGIADALDFRDRAELVGDVLAAASTYVNAIVADTADSANVRVDRNKIAAILAESTADIVDMLANIAEDLRHLAQHAA